MELEATWQRIIRVWWRFFWQGSMLGFIFYVMIWTAGAGVGFVLDKIGVPHELLNNLGDAATLAMSIVLSILPFFLIINNNYGEFRLSMIPKNDVEAKTDDVNEIK